MAFTYGTVTNCKVYSGATRDEYECRLGYEVQSQSIANNTSTIKLRLQVRSINSSYATYGYNQTTTIDGTALSAKSFDMRDTNTWQTFGERTITVTHNASTGKYSATKTGSFTTTGNSTWNLKSGSASVTVNPPTIPRYATANQSLNSKTSSSIKMNWSSDNTIDYIWYSKDNGSSWIGVDVTDGTSGTYTISGLSANTTYNIKTRVRRKDSQLTTDSSALSVTTHAKTVASISVSSKTSSSVTVSSNCSVTTSSTKYRIMKSGGSYGSWQTSATFSGLSANTTYTVQVEKIGSASGEAGYATVSVTTHAKTTPTIALSSKTINSITVSSNCNVAVSSTKYRIKKSGGSYGSYQTSATFSGLSPNTAYVIEVKKVGTSSGESGTATLNVTTYDIGKITSAPNINFGDTARIVKTNPGNATNNLRVETLNPSTTIATRNGIGNDYTITFSDSEWDSLYKKLGTNNSITIRYVIDTKGTTTYHNYVDKTLTLKGNQKTAHLGVNGVKKRTKVFLGVNGSVKRAVVWIGNNGRKRCI